MYAKEAKTTPYPKKKMNFLKRWFLRKIRSGIQDLNENGVEIVNAVGVEPVIRSIDNSRLINSEKTIRFHIHFANGGRIVETLQHDRKSDRSTNGLYIVTNDQDFGKELDKIITMESLKN